MSQDILFIILIIAIIWLTIFFSIALFYLIVILREFRSLARLFREGLKSGEDIFALLKDRLRSGATYIALFAKGLDEVLKYLKTRKKKK